MYRISRVVFQLFLLMPHLLAFRDKLLPRSETFVLRHYERTTRWRPVFAGVRRAAESLDIGAAPVFTAAEDEGRGAALRLKFAGRAPGLEAFARAHDVRLIHAHFGKSGAIALPMARALDLPLVVSFHGGDATKRRHFRPWPKGGVFARRLDALKRETALFLTDSGFIRDKLIARGFAAERIRPHHIGVDAGRYAFAPEQGRFDEALFVGRFVEKKGLPDLFAAMRRVWAKRPELRLVLIGDGPLRTLVEAEIAAGGPIDWLGWRDQAEVRARLARARLSVTPSREAPNGDCEGLPSVLYEAAAMGAPIVATAHSGAPEAIRDGENGLLTPEGDVAALSDAILRLAGDAGLRASLAAAARRDAETVLDAAARASDLEAAFDAVIAGR